eukprot:TRINITY_DN4190_c0_g2_i1.p1 TRINITY_DN4190_c0_g2~~TRINITY_DN4190_c0_g2_i1.p1  ORF type:complete len:575 (+),score=42.74 TRINITY_DN4190_c0_g2_i1:38-1762(+)
MCRVTIREFSITLNAGSPQARRPVKNVRPLRITLYPWPFRWSLAVFWLIIDRAVCDRIDGFTLFEDDEANCENPPYGPHVRGTPAQQSEDLAHWRALPSVKHEEMDPLPAFMIMVYHSLAFPKSWKTFFKQADEGSFRLLIHSKMPPRNMPEFFRKYLITDAVPTEHCACVGLVMYMMQKLLEDPKVSHFVLLSGDSLPVKPMKHILVDLTDDSRSRFCIDGEISRAETFFSMRRDLAMFYRQHLPDLQKMTDTVCPDEDLFYYGAFLRGESVANSCIFLSDWTGTLKFWQANAKRCNCPTFLKSPKIINADCGHPAVIGNVSLEALMDVADSPAGYWFVRKFCGDGIEGNAFLHTDSPVIGGVDVQILSGQLLDLIATRLLKWKAKKGPRNRLMIVPMRHVPPPVLVSESAHVFSAGVTDDPRQVGPSLRQALEMSQVIHSPRAAPETPQVEFLLQGNKPMQEVAPGERPQLSRGSPQKAPFPRSNHVEGTMFTPGVERGGPEEQAPEAYVDRQGLSPGALHSKSLTSETPEFELVHPIRAANTITPVPGRQSGGFRVRASSDGNIQLSTISS